MIPRRRPIPRLRPKPESSLRYETIQAGVIRFSDGREICQPTAAGWREYARRVEAMVRRQNFRCCLCNRPLSVKNATFEHQRRRGMGAAFRDDRIEKDGEIFNGAAHWICNSEKG